MVALLFTLYFISAILSLNGKECFATGLYMLTLVLCVCWFFAHVTTTVQIQL